MWKSWSSGDADIAGGVVGLRVQSDLWLDRATSLFAMALKAHEDDRPELADELTKLALGA